MKFLKDISLKGKKILYRVDINSPIHGGKILDTTRIESILPTLRFLLGSGVKQVIILAHQGRDKHRSSENTLDLHAKLLETYIKKKVMKLDQCRGITIPEKAEVVMLENLRLDDEDYPDQKKREAFARDLSKLGDIYINDAFGACHRDHATITSLPNLMKEKAAGLLLEKEITALRPLMDGKIESPFTIIVGGAKTDTKLPILRYFSPTVDFVLTGGGVANTFLFAEGYDVGASLYEEDAMEEAQEIALMLDGDKNRLHIPTDVVCADDPGEEVFAVDIPVEDVMGDMKILDVGRKTIEQYVEVIRQSKTILWNGPLGFFEYAPFQRGSAAIARAIADRQGTTIIGGGETIAVINELKIPREKFTHVSTGGGAMLEYLSGKKLPGITALSNHP